MPNQLGLLTIINILIISIIVSSCNKSIKDLEDTLIQDQQTNESIYCDFVLSSNLPKVMYEYPIFSTDTNLKRKIEFKYDSLTNNIRQLINGNGTTYFDYRSDTILMNINNKNKVILKMINDRVDLKITGAPFKYTYDDRGLLISADCGEWKENYYYKNGDLYFRETQITKLNDIPDLSYVSYFDYYDSICLGINLSYVQFNLTDYFISGIDGQRYLNVYGYPKKHLLKSMKLYSPYYKDTDVYNYNWKIENNQIKQVDIWYNSAIIRRGVIESYYD